MKEKQQKSNEQLSLHSAMSIVALLPLVALLALSSALHASPVCASASTTPATSYLGCFTDKLDVRLRALPYVQSIDAKQMSVQRCTDICTKRGYEYIGLQYRTECYCSKNPPAYGEVAKQDAAKCDSVCVADKPEDGLKCGGPLALSVYRTAEPPPEPVSQRPLVCLVMILKDEAHTVKNTFETIKDAIDCAVILDTGSTDGTQKVITDFFDPLHDRIKLKIYEEPFMSVSAL